MFELAARYAGWKQWCDECGHGAWDHTPHVAGCDNDKEKATRCEAGCTQCGCEAGRWPGPGRPFGLEIGPTPRPAEPDSFAADDEAVDLHEPSVEVTEMEVTEIEALAPAEESK